MGEQGCVCDSMHGVQCALHAELTQRVRWEGFEAVARSLGWLAPTDRRNDLLNIRGLLSPNGGIQVVPMELGDTVAPAVEWLIRDHAALTDQLADARREMEGLRAELADADRRRSEFDERVSAQVEDLRAELAAQAPGWESPAALQAAYSDILARFGQAEAERARRSDELRRAQGVIEAAKAWYAACDPGAIAAPDVRAAGIRLAAAIDALGGDDPKEVVRDAPGADGL